ncbi:MULTISPECIES: hypothetical protein [unclassified Agrococcus]|uniref:hypothetical protein n=1 Tax=unclassified Agrococcus TaxID=2615065 RepID=UPI0036079C44
MSPWWAVATFVVTVFTAGGLARLVDPAASADSPSLLWAAPAVAAGVTWLIGRRALAIMLPGPVPRRQLVAHTILGAAAAALVVVLAAAGIGIATGIDAIPEHDARVDVLPLWLLAVPCAFALELGWRGTLQPLVESRLGRMGASVAVGLVWAAWRLEVDEASTIVGTIVTSIALSVLLGYLSTGAWWQRWITAGVAQSILTFAFAGFAWDGPRSLIVAAASVVVTVAWLLMFRSAQRRRARAADAA